jgi:hypothetical protein
VDARRGRAQYFFIVTRRRPFPWAWATALAIAGITCVAAASSGQPLHLPKDVEERAVAERRFVTVRLDPRAGARPGECDTLEAADLQVVLGNERRAAKVVAVEHVPRPERHWLMVDISESAEGRREAALTSALQYVRNVMIPGEDVAALVAVDEDPILVDGPTTDPHRLERKIAEVSAGGWSSLRDGLDTVLRQVQGDRQEHVVLFWTDGEDVSSTIRHDDLLATLGRTANATVFPICLLPSGARFPPPPLTGATFTEVARRSGGEVFISTDPRWLERVRGWLGRRFTVTYFAGSADEAVKPLQRGEITAPWKRCEVTILRDPFAIPDPVAGEAPPAPVSWTKLHAKSRNSDDPGCATPKGTTAWAWPLSTDAASLSGCVLDIVRATGPTVRERENGVADYDPFQSPLIAAREIRVDAPSLDALPTDPATAVASLLLDDVAKSDGVSRSFMDGGAFLAQRAQIAASLFAHRPDLHDFAVARLGRFAEVELRAIAQDFARMFPKVPPAEVEAIARASRAGTRALKSASHPTDADLARVLAAWIGDVHAVDLMRALERLLIDRRIEAAPTGDAERLWAAAVARFGLPSRIRIETPLTLVHDPGQDVVGFVRVVLPRPEVFRERGVPIDKRLIRRPLALGLIDRFVVDPRVAGALADGGYRATSIGYRALSVPFKHDPGLPYEEARVTVRLEAPAPDGVEPLRIVVEGDVRASGSGPMTVARLVPKVTGDPGLAALLRASRATPRPRSRPRRLAHGRPVGVKRMVLTVRVRRSHPRRRITEAQP